jgi:hypothetical protein
MEWVRWRQHLGKWTRKINSAAEKAIWTSGMCFGALTVAAGALVGLYELVFWLRFAKWPGYQAWDLAVPFLRPDSWLFHPRNWYGLHKIVVWLLQTRLWLFLVLVGGGIALFFLNALYEGGDKSKVVPHVQS